MNIRTAVMCRNSEGAPEVVHFEISCTQDQYDKGVHYDQAKALASDQGFAPVMAFDERDPAWKSLAALRTEAEAAQSQEADLHETFFELAVTRMKEAFLEGYQVECADFVEEMGSVVCVFVEKAADAGHSFDVFVAHSENGYWDPCKGLDVFEPAIVMCKGEAQGLEGHATVVKLPLVKLVSDSNSGGFCLPPHEDLLEMAEQGIARSVRAGFSISLENAAEVMREEANLLHIKMPEELAPILEAVILRALEVQRHAMREGE